MSGIKVIWRQDCYALLTDREPFGFKDGISHPAVEGSGIPGTNPRERPIKAGEIILGYKDELGEISAIPQPEMLGKNGTYIVFRKLHQRVAAFRQYLRASASNPEAEELLAAKMMGRWRSGAPLVLAPERDDPALGADPTRNNNFLYNADGDEKGLSCPVGSHARRANPRDSLDFGDVNIRRMIRRGTAYGPLLPEGVLEDDGADPGLCFVFVGAHLKRQYEFVQTQWLNDGIFIGAPAQKDPIVGPNDGTGVFTIPTKPIRRRLQGLPRFVVTRGGEYFFMPGLKALSWLADLDT
jgi:Dyp-type peroxidase family